MSAAGLAALALVVGWATGCDRSGAGATAAGEGASVEPASASAPTPAAARSETPPPAESVRAAAGQDAGESKAEQAPRPRSDAPSKIEEATFVRDPGEAGLRTFADAWTGGGSLWVGPFDANGGRDAVIFIPAGADPKADFLLVYHFHGTYSEHIEAERAGVKKRKWVGEKRLHQTIEASIDLQTARPHNVALVYPLSAGKRPEPDHKGWYNRDYDRIWMKHDESFDALHTQALDVLTSTLGVHRDRVLPRVIAEGHSAGGIALKNIADSGTSRVGEYIFLDASFQDWADGCWAAVREGDLDAHITIVLTDKGIADPWVGRSPWCAELQADAGAWREHSGWCEGKPEETPPGAARTCTQIEEGATDWPDYRDWCEAMKKDLVDLPGVTLHRTKVRHGEQPRRFSGGLDLPERPGAPG